MTQNFRSEPVFRSKRELQVARLSRLKDRRRIRHNKKRHDTKPRKRHQLTSNATLLARSKEMLKDLLHKFGSKTTDDDIFKAMLKAKIGDKFRRTQRKHRQKTLAVASALYHVISRNNDPVAALQILVKKMNVSPPRGSDLCRTIVECLFDYGSSPEERTRNRQYACSDANALRYVVRKEIEPQKVLQPEEGEFITKWAKLEAEFRRPQKASRDRPEKAETRNSTTPKSAKQKLVVLPGTKQLRRLLKQWVKNALFVADLGNSQKSAWQSWQPRLRVLYQPSLIKTHEPNRAVRWT